MRRREIIPRPHRSRKGEGKREGEMDMPAGMDVEISKEGARREEIS